MTPYRGEYRPQSDLCAGWHLDNLYDFSGNGKTMTNVGAATFVELTLPDGKIGKCLALGSPNSTKYLTVTSTAGAADIDIDLSANAITVAGWIRITALPAASAYPTIVQWDAVQTTDRYAAIFYKNDGGIYKLQANFSGTVISYSVTLTVDTWHWVVLTAAAGAGAVTALYLDGVLVASGVKGSSASSGTTKIQIGKHIAQAQYWPGQIYQVAAYKKAFTASEILKWYNYMIGTVSSVLAVSLDGTDLGHYLKTAEGMAPDGGEIKMDSTLTPFGDFAQIDYGGRSEKQYKFNLIFPTRATMETILGTINNVEELAEFTPFTEDRITLVKRAGAVVDNPILYWPTAAGGWKFVANCRIYTIDSLQYSRQKVLFAGENVVVPTESVSIVNGGTYKSGIDYFLASGYYDTGATTWTTDLKLLINGNEIDLCDKLLHDTEFVINRYGDISHTYYTDFDIALADVQAQLDSDSPVTAATAGYHLGGRDPDPRLDKVPSEKGFMIKVDSEASYSHVVLTSASCTSLPALVVEMENKIQALGSAYAAVKVALVNNCLKITSGTTGATSKVRIKSSEFDYGDDCCHHLDIGTGWMDENEDFYLVGEDHDGTAASSKLIDLGSSTAGYHTSGEIPATVITGAGFHISGANPITDLSKGYGSSGKLKIQNDAEGSATEITLTLSSCDTATNTAAQIQTKIRAISAAYDACLVRYENGRFVVISESTASTSKVRITDGATVNVANHLKLGTANGGTNFDGSATTKNKFAIQADAEASPTTITLTLTGLTTGAAIASHIQTQIRAAGGAYSDITVVYIGGRYKITSETTGAASKIRITSDASNDIADRLKIGTANGGTDTDGTAGSIAKNALVLSTGGQFTVALYGPIPTSSPPYIEFFVSSLTGTPRAVYLDEDSNYVYMTDEIVPGQNRIYFPDLQAKDDFRIGIYCDADSTISLYDFEAGAKRNVSSAFFPRADPGDTIAFSISAGGSAKLSNLALYYRDAYWS